jgi:hypothetical protein
MKAKKPPLFLRSSRPLRVVGPQATGAACHACRHVASIFYSVSSIPLSPNARGGVGLRTLDATSFNTLTQKD